VSTFVALLRAVNVGGRNRIAMTDLREVVESLGHAQVATYIQSGNVVFAAEAGLEPTDQDELARALRAAIGERLRLDIGVVVRDRASLARIVEAVPFPDADPKQLLIAFLAATPAPEAREALELAATWPEEVRLNGREAYLHLPNGVGRSVLAPLVERRLRTQATARNLATVRALLAMLEGIEGAVPDPGVHGPTGGPTGGSAGAPAVDGPVP